MILWRAVSKALRACLVEEHESVRWRSFAVVFAGAIEQRILGFRPISAAEDEFHPDGSHKRLLEYLQESEHDDRDQ